MLSAGAATAPAQLPGPVSLDPGVAGQGTALLVAADATVLSPGGRSPGSLTIVLPRGTRLDTAARKPLCGAGETVCPESSRIGFGRFIVTVRGYLLGAGETQLAWAVNAFLARPSQRGDAASVVLSSTLLGADSVGQLLAPALGSPVPVTATSSARIVRRASGIELRLAQMPVELAVTAPVTAAPARLELALSAVRRTRQNFIRRFRVRTPSGYQVRRIRDHRLVGHDLLRAPRTCRGSWPYELSVGFPDGTRRSSGSIACTKPVSGAPSAARRRAGSSRR
jgi:hypothetical protein